jgi:predicted dehydrogenase
MGNVRVGVIGCGDVAQHSYVPGLRKLHEQGVIQLEALCDTQPGRAADMARRLGVPNAYVEIDELLESGIDLVVNLTPMPVHAQVSLKAIAAQKHVYSEKPIATRLEDADQIIAEAQRQDVKVGAAPALLTHPDVQQTISWLDDGVIGKVCFVRARASNPGPDRITDFTTDPSWFYLPGGGPLYDLAVYPLQVITGALGPVKRVSAFSGVAVRERVARYGVAKGKRVDVGVADNTHMLLDFGDAVFASIDATYCVLSSQGPRMEFYGPVGVMNLASTVDDPPISVFRAEEDTELRGWLVPEKVYRGRVNPPRERVPRPEYGLVNGVAHLVDHLIGRARLLLTAEHARHVLEVLLAVEESADRGKAIDLTTTFVRPAF